MRPGQNKRMRGRNRRGPNPLTRSYESNGPDVKIRGTAAHIAEKYVQLARDAHASGDPVAAESYLQHAEHYLRLIAAAQQAQFQAQQAAMGIKVDDSEELDDDEFESSVMDRFTFRAPQAPGQQPQDGQQPDVPRPDFPGQPRQDQPRGDFQPRHDQRGGGDRPYGDQRPRHGDFRRDRQFDRNGQQQRFDRPRPQSEEGGDIGLPGFITAPVRVPIDVAGQPGQGDQPDVPEGAMPQDEEGYGRFPMRSRRRRRGRGPRDE
ncbi:MAG TPA: DUF4167 domain-containing protein, partial [Beijerinckiaceae bacterium]|nr:DUF4167 domain-containing protein [Beijerinckiaceae bacterium]